MSCMQKSCKPMVDTELMTSWVCSEQCVMGYLVPYAVMRMCVCRSNIRKAHVSAIIFALSQSFLFFAYAAIFTFATWLIINRGLNFEDMFK